MESQPTSLPQVWFLIGQKSLCSHFQLTICDTSNLCSLFRPSQCQLEGYALPYAACVALKELLAPWEAQRRSPKKPRRWRRRNWRQAHWADLGIIGEMAMLEWPGHSILLQKAHYDGFRRIGEYMYIDNIIMPKFLITQWHILGNIHHPLMEPIQWHVPIGGDAILIM